LWRWRCGADFCAAAAYYWFNRQTYEVVWNDPASSDASAAYALMYGL
jgi:hypothetical protein